MKNRNGVRSSVGMVLVAVWAAVAAPVLPQAQGDPQMSPEQKAQMEAWTKAMTPGKPHQDMAAKVGSWEGTVSMWEAPGAPPQISQARSERTMALGGRVLVDHWNGTMMGMPFEGMGMTGFDNANGKWWSTWSDNFSTGVMTGVGNCEVDHQRGCTFTSTYTDPMTGKEKKNRSTVIWPTPDDERMEMFETGADGKEWKMMEIVIHRVKK